MQLDLQAGHVGRMGANFDGEGTHFAVFSEHAEQVELCIFSADGHSELARCALPERTGAVWHGYAPGLRPGSLYGYRVQGAYQPEHGHRFNPHKLLLDPYTRSFSGHWTYHPAVYGYQHNTVDDLSFCNLDSAPHVPKSIVPDPDDFPLLLQQGDVIAKSWEHTLIYEAHVKGLTQAHPGVPEEVRGCYEGVVSDVMLEHLLKQGVTTLELLPVHAFVDEHFLVKRGLSNYWGYNTIGFLAPEPRYMGKRGIAGFRYMVERLHQAGIEVVLDVVFNHTAEGDHLGPTWCYRGLDNAAYYRLDQAQPRYYVNDTGCGNTLNTANPYVMRLVMDSLRFWMQVMGVDGFRFDLATVLGREAHGGFEPGAALLDAIRQDPILAQARLIAEPWDVGHEGYRLGEFPPEFVEWNDTYRDAVRRFWRGDEFSAQELGRGLLGTAELFDKSGRRPWSSVNLVTSHDGFTLADCTRYNERHNQANLEENRDGHHANYSDNCGVEGETSDPVIMKRRLQRQRNMLATLFLSQGTPMLLAGDEIGNSQRGNNNAYCQDNPLGWLDWEQADPELAAFVAQLSAFRYQHPVVRQTLFLHGKERVDGLLDVVWRGFDGQPANWSDPQLAGFCLLLRCSAEAPLHVDCRGWVLLVLKRNEAENEVVLPELPQGWGWECGIDSRLQLSPGSLLSEGGDLQEKKRETIKLSSPAILACVAVLKHADNTKCGAELEGGYDECD